MLFAVRGHVAGAIQDVELGMDPNATSKRTDPSGEYPLKKNRSYYLRSVPENAIMSGVWCGG